MTGRSIDPSKRLIVVLGAHRSGTSAIARALPVLGAEMGDNLLPPDHRNAKGYWEDQDIKLLNDRLLKSVGSRWDHISFLSDKHVSALNAASFPQEAADILRSKTSKAGIYGLKEPQITKLLPFWNEVFKRLQLDHQFILALRNPLSSAISLTKRDGLTRRHGYDLWFSQMMMAIRHSAGVPLVMVEYDRLLNNPEFEIQRLAQSLGLNLDADKFATYSKHFLDVDLRHSEHSLADLRADRECPDHVRQLYVVLREQARLPGKVNPANMLAASQSLLSVQQTIVDEAQIFDAELREIRAKAEEFSSLRIVRKFLRRLRHFFDSDKKF